MEGKRIYEVDEQLYDELKSIIHDIIIDKLGPIESKSLADEILEKMDDTIIYGNIP